MNATRISIAALMVSFAALGLPAPALAQTKDDHAAVEQRIMAAIRAAYANYQKRVNECLDATRAHYPGDDVVGQRAGETNGCIIAHHIEEDYDRERLALKAEGCRLGVYWFCQKEP